MGDNVGERGIFGGGSSAGPVGTGPAGQPMDGWTGPPRGEPLDSGPNAKLKETKDVMKGVTFYTKETETGWELEVDNGNVDYVVATVKLTTALDNVKTTQKFPVKTTLAPSSGRTRIAVFTIIDLSKASAQPGLDFDVQFGDPTATQDSTLYGFPFAKGAAFKCVQSFGGAQTHTGANAVDFEMPVGTAVHAAREGTVVETKQDSNQGGPGKAFEPMANFVRILHSDRTYGRYLHLQQNGSKVSVGDKVTKGQQIASSGNTGQSSAPHLHFDVSISDGKGGMKTADWGFEKDGVKYVPKAGDMCTNPK
ncbi:MAG: M23 family metallopeptidase [Bryobacteraceae bacterium]